jgi:serine phosphatase RsbU (regulator of sigma subunit)/pSer/pThr/pTyr-binding forkhead associated (FHA) protein
MATLVLEEDGRSISYSIPEGETMIGRHPGCGVHLIGGTVSGNHAKLVKDGDIHTLEDQGSRNGTFVNGERISQPTRLKNRDQILFGRVQMRFEAPELASKATVSSAARDTVDVTPDQAAKLSGMPDDDDSSERVNIASGDDDRATIVGSLDGIGRNLLEAQPEVKLKAVLDISTSLAGAVELQTMLPRILDALFSIFPYADRGCILLKEPGTGKMVPRAVKHRRADRDDTVRLSRTIVSKVLEEKHGILSADASSDAQFGASESISELRIRSMMCVPMLDLKGEPAGLISIDSQNPLGQFKKEDLELLAVVAGQAALAYETARLMQSYVEKQKQDNEMAIARDVQLALLPVELPKAEGYEFFASYDSAQAVGGDYYDAFVLGDDKICLSFGDVAGKGVPGALIMSRMSSVVQSTIRHVHEVGAAIDAINAHMCDSAVEGRFVTYVMVMIDLNTHTMTLANAGHMSPMLRKPDGSVEELVEEDLCGPPIGVVDEYPYDVVTRSLNPGETVVIVTDGVDEALNPEGDLYGKQRVIEFIKNSSPKADELGKALLADVRRHAAGRPQNDDITIMTFGRNP